jgi:CRISPR-associated endonuclease/helicase Cas3
MKSKNFKRLLAKSLPLSKKEEDLHPMAKGAATYTGHIQAVMNSADVLLEKLGATILNQLGLPEIDLEYFHNTVRLGAYLHDWGKANQHFQEMVYLKSLDPKLLDQKNRQYRKRIQESSKEHGDRQMIRHEIISGILALGVPSIRQWLEKAPNTDLIAAVWAAMGHHLKIGLDKYKKPSGCITEIIDITGENLEIYTHHPDFNTILKIGQKIGLPTDLPELPEETWTKSQIQEQLKALRKEFIDIQESIKEQKNWQRQKFIAAVKATVIAADLAGSALPARGYDLQDWIAQVLDLVLSEAEISQLLEQRLKGQTLRPFQQQIAATKNRVTLVKAGCGTGKTAAAYAWGKKWAKGRKLFFGYPTTGTASQGYLDYAAETEIETQLIHSRAEIDLEEILFSRESENEPNEHDAEGIDSRLAAFAAWQAKLIVCTVDSVLGLIQNNRKPLYSWPAICQSAFVFDEVHAYDDRLFGALLRFLQTFTGAPILLMSASFTEGQLAAIQQVMDELGEEIQIIEGPQNLETIPRYQLQKIQEMPQIWQTVIETLANRQKAAKILWVTNSVQSCIDLYRQAKDELAEHLPNLPIQPLIYHSRYRYQDRLAKHKTVVEAFKGDSPVLAITTQVCEMSLDLSADLLVSAIAPAAALIQRLGRLNRYVVIDEIGNVRLISGGICPAIIYAWDNAKPYEKLELATGEKLLKELAGLAISQADLAEVAATLDSTQPTPVESQWLHGHWCNYPGFLRDAGYTITVLLEQDIAKIKDAANQRQDKSFMKAAQRWSVPIQIMPGFRSWRRIGFYPVCPADVIIYSEETGAEPCKSN